MKLERSPRETLLPGKYVGKNPEDIYLRRGDSWFSANGEYRVTIKKYIMKDNNEYDIEIDADPVLNAEQGIDHLNQGQQESSALPDLPNPSMDTYEHHLIIAVGDDYLDKNGKMWKVTGKYFREMSGGRLKIGFYYA
jgi:hypothetical protein